MNYSEALEFIHGVNFTFCKPGLERIRELCLRLGNPQDGLKFIHVAGTNGKGSFCSMLSSVLRAAGYKTGLYTSPYVLRFNERMQVDGVQITDEALCRLCDTVKPIADEMADKPTEFELITAIAFLYFKEMGCEYVVLEVGMGGRLDATNIIENPVLSVITGIALDHTAYLGDTVEKIAAEKAGIIKNAPTLFGGTSDGAAGVIEDAARRFGVPYARVDYSSLSVLESSVFGSTFNFGEWKNIKVSLAGLYQPRNGAVVLSAIEILRKGGIEIPDSAVYEGLCRAKWKARFEVLLNEPLLIFDGAHNPEGVSAAVESIKEYFQKPVHVLTGVLRDKDYRYIAKKISEVADFVSTVTPDNPRALSATEYKEIFTECNVNSEAYGDLGSALLSALQRARDEGAALICLGSLYTYVDLIKILNEKEILK